MLCVIKTRYCLEHVFYRLHNLLNASVVVVLENPLRSEGREHRFSLLMGQWQGSGRACDLGRHCAFMKNPPQCSLLGLAVTPYITLPVAPCSVFCKSLITGMTQD